MRDVVPVKYWSTSSGSRPTASKICAPEYERTVEMPIFEMVFRTALPMALTMLRSASAASLTPGSWPRSCITCSVSKARYGLIAEAP